MQKKLFTFLSAVFLFTCLNPTLTFAQYIPPVMIEDGQIMLAIEGDSAKEVFNALQGQESSTAGHTFKFGKNLVCNRYDNDYFCVTRFDMKGYSSASSVIAGIRKKLSTNKDLKQQIEAIKQKLIADNGQT